MANSRLPLILIVVFFGLFVISFILFFVIPPQMEGHIQVDTHTQYYTALGDDNFTSWENIPGSRDVSKTHTFQFYNVANPNSMQLAMGMQPVVT